MNAANGGGSRTMGGTFTSPNTFISPDITESSLVCAHSEVYTESELTITIKPSYQIVQNSKILVELPDMYTDNNGDPIPYVKTGYGCSAVANINSGVGCNYDSNSKTLTISNGFPADVNSGTEIKIKVTKFYTPISTSTYSDFNIYITTSDGRKYMKKKNLGIKVDNAKAVTSFLVSQGGRSVASTATLVCTIGFSAHVNQDFYFEVTTTSGMVLTNAIATGFKQIGTNTATVLKSGGTGGVALTNPTGTIIISNVLNRNWAQDSQISIKFFDGNGNIAQQTAAVTLSFTALDIDPITIVASPKSLGTNTELTINWKAMSEYLASSQLFITTPSKLTKVALACKNQGTSGKDPATCNNAGDDVTVSTLYTATINKGDTTDLKLSGVRLPYCAADYSYGVTVKTTGGTYEINKATLIMKTADFIKDTLTFQTITPTSTVAGKESTIDLSFSYNAVLQSASKITFTLHNEITWIDGTSGCSVTAGGLAAGVTCVRAGQLLTISNGLTADKAHGGVNIVVQVSKIGNPRAIGAYTVDAKIETTTGSICEYAAGQATFSVTTVDNITATVTPAVNNRNLYTTYRVVLNSETASWVNTDFVEVVFPADAGMAFSTTLNCKAISNNLISVTCTSTSANIIKAQTNINSGNYNTNKKIEFDIEFVQNPDIQSTKSGFEVHVKTQSGGSYVMDTQIDVLYAGYVSPTLTEGTYISKKKGEDNYITVNIKVDAFIPKGGEFELEFVDANKFILLGNETLKASTPSLAVQQTTTSTAQDVEGISRRILIDTENRKIRLATNADIAPNTDISFELNMRNPMTNTVSSPDMIVRLFINNKMVFQNNGFNAQITFTCDEFCTDCDKLWYKCTSCIAGKVLTGDKCGDPVKETLMGTSIPFLFTGIALIMFLGVWIIGKCWRNRNFSGNYLYALLKFNYFAALIGITVFFFINKDPRIYSYLMCGVILFHIILSWVSARSFRTVYLHRKFGGCSIGGTPVVGKPAPIFFGSRQEYIFQRLSEAISRPKEEDPEYIRMVGTKKEKGCLFSTYTSQIFMIFFHGHVTRIFFSSVANGKKSKERHKQVTERALFWTWDQRSYEELKKSYSKHRNYYTFFQFLVVILLIFSCLGIGESEAYIYLFKFDLGAVTLIDIVAYMYAYNELNPRKKRKNPKEEEPEDEENKAVDEKEDPNVLKDKNGNVIGKKEKDGVFYDEHGNTLTKGKDGKIYVKDKDGNLIAIYDSDGNKFDRFGNKVEDDPDGGMKVFNKKGDHIATFDKDGNLVDKKGNILMKKDEYEDMIDKGYKMDQNGNLHNAKDGWYYDPETKRKYKLGKKGEKLFVDPKTGKLYVDGKKGEKVFYDPDTGLYYIEKDGKTVICNDKGKPLSKKELEKLVSKGKIKLGKDGNIVILNKKNNLKDPSLATRLEKDEDGVYRPKLIDRPDSRKTMKEDQKITKKLEQSIGDSKAKSKIFDDRTKNLKYAMDKSDASGDLKSNMKQDPELARKNAKFDKWWYTADKNYLEIIYEEDENDNPHIYENPDYEDKEMDRKMNNRKRPDGKALGNETPRENLHKMFGKDENDMATENTKDESKIKFKHDSVTKEQAMAREGYMSDRKIGTTKNQDAKNNSEETLNDQSVPLALCDKKGYFMGTDGKHYKFDKNHNMLRKDDLIVPLKDVKKKIGRQNVDKVPNVLRKYKTDYPPVETNDEGEFIGNDGKKYSFDENGNLVDQNGEVVPLAQGKEITRDLNVDDVKNCPNKYKLDLVRPIVTKDGTFFANDGKPYQFDRSGNMYDSTGRQLPKKEILERIEGLDVDYVPNCPNKYKVEPAMITPKKNGKFKGNNGKYYSFSREGSLLDEDGNEVPKDEADIILQNLNLDEVPHVPPRYKTDEKKPTLDKDGYFIGNDGEKYKFDENGNMLDKNGNVVPKHKADAVVVGLNLDHLDNTPNEYRKERKPEAPLVKRDGAFLGADGKNYRFDREGRLLDEKGDIVPNDKIPLILDGIIVDNVPGCPDHLKHPKEPIQDKKGYFIGADGDKYKFDPNGDLVDESGNKVPRDKIHQKLKGLDFRNLPNAPKEAKEGDPRLASRMNPFGVLKLQPGDPRAPSRFRQSDANYTRLGSVTVDSQKERLTNPHMGDTMYVNLLADESFDLDINVEEIDDDEYNPENEKIYAQPFLKQFDERDFQNDNEFDDDRGSRLSKLGMRNINSRTSLNGPKKTKKKNNLITKGKRVDTRKGNAGRSNNKIVHQPRLGYRDSLTSTLKGGRGSNQKPIRKHASRAGPRSAMGVDLRKRTKSKKRKGRTMKKNDSASSFGTFMLNKLDKKKGRTSGIGFIKPYRRQQMNKTASNFSNDKLLSIKQIYIDNIEKEKKKNPYSRSHSRANLHM